MNTIYKSNHNIVYSCKYHVVWCPKYRRKILTNGVDVRLKELLTEYAANLSVDILEMEIMPDHVHMLLEVDPQFGIHKAVKSFKGYTSRILRQEFPYLKTKMPTLWTNSYFISTVGGAPMEAVKQYIENQKTSQRQKDKMGYCKKELNLESTRTENRKTSSIRPWDAAGSSTTGDLPCVRKPLRMEVRSDIPRLLQC